MTQTPPEQQDLQEQPSRRGARTLPVVVGLVGAVAVVAAAVLVPRALQDRDADGAPGTRTGTDIEGMSVVEDRRTDHTTDPVDYPERPPLGGPHDPVWLACGVYDEPLRDENAVHDLEHGAIWIAYQPDLAEDEVAALADLLPDNGIMAPYPDLASPVVVTAWERQLAVESPEDPRIATFLREFEGGGTAPEAFVTCQGGTTDPGGVVLDG
ncbi:MAG: DUF3105 domain-containing protein [Nocardioides sp.]|nr:DUF3105 domain-containing protein [Nocardioides sp.]